MMHYHLPRNLRAAAPAAALALAACGGGSAGGTGSLTLDVTDAKIDDAEAVNVVFTGIVLQPRDGERIEFTCDAPIADPAFDCDGKGSRMIDLLELSGDRSETLLDAASVPAGAYDWIRLRVDAATPAPGPGGASTIELKDGSVHELVVPSGRQTGLKLVEGFTVAADGSASFTIDFDLRKAITLSAVGYMLRPALRLVDNSNAGHLAGEITLAFANAQCPSPDADGWSFAEDGLAVYVYAGTDADTGDLGGPDAPLATGLAELDQASGYFDYRVGFLPAGPYTAAVVCNPKADDEDAGDDTLAIAATTTVSVAPAPPRTVQNFNLQ